MITSTLNKDAIRAAMVGHWHEVLPVAGMEPGRKYPCPKCGGDTRFNIDDHDFQETGAVWCHICFGTKEQGNHGDGFAALEWLHGYQFTECLAYLARHLNMEPGSSAGWSRPPALGPADLLADWCKLKRIPTVEALRAFGARIGARPISGRDPLVCIEVPMFSDLGQECGIQDSHPRPPADIPEKVHEQLPKGMHRPRPKGQGSMVGLFLPVDGIGNSGRLLIVEGVKDAATLWHHGHRQVIGFPGSVPRKALHQILRSAAGEAQGAFDVLLVPHLDSGGDRNTRALESALSGHPAVASVTMARLPGARRQKKGVDVRDAIAAAGWDSVQWAIDHPIEIPTSDRPSIILDATRETHHYVGEAFRHIAALGWESPWIPPEESEELRVFHRGGVMVQVVQDDDNSPSIAPLKEYAIQNRLHSAARFKEQKVDREGNIELTETKPPAMIVKTMMQEPNMVTRHLRPLAGLLTAPTLRADGSILQEPGYDDLSGLLLLPGDYPTIPENPTFAQVKDSLDILWEPVSEFLWKDPSQDFAGWLSYVFTLMVRRSIDGGVPMWAFNGNNQGTGKTKLTNLAHLIAFGRKVEIQTWETNPDESRKSITSLLMRGAPSVVFDNLRGRMNNQKIEAAITTEKWTDRLLGSNEQIVLHNNIVFAITGNNLQFGGDTRRYLMVELRSPNERPDCRTFARVVDVWVAENRRRLVEAALTILRYRWVADGHVESGRLLPVLGKQGSETGCGFDGWSLWVRDAVYLATGIDPWIGNKAVRAIDHEEEQLSAIHAYLPKSPSSGIAARHLIPERLPEGEIAETTVTESQRDFFEALGLDYTTTSAVSLGKILDRFIDRPFRGWVMEKDKDRSGTYVYRLIPSRPPAGG